MRLLNKRNLIVVSGILFLLLMGIEFYLRTQLGFCSTVLMKEDSTYEYIAEPNQEHWRFRHRIKYNSFSMRSEEPDSTALTILGFGDSVINGGVMTDQDSLATTLLTNQLSQTCHRKVQILNISAGSWGPDNCFAYLEKHGNFNTKGMFLVISSHDAYDVMNFEKVVGVNKSFPSKQYKLALYELLDRYILPRIFKEEDVNSSTNALGINKKTESAVFNPGIKAFIEYSKKRSLPFVVYLHAETSEIAEGKYNAQGQEILNFLAQEGILTITELDHGFSVSDFRDNIHLNDVGQRKLSQVLFPFCKSVCEP